MFNLYNMNILTQKQYYLQFGMHMPAGIPLPANVKISKDVKSGRKNLSFSYSAGHGRRGRNSVAAFTKSANLTLMGLFTTATNPKQ